MLLETIAYFFIVTMPTIINAIIIVLGFIAVIVLMVISIIKNKTDIAVQILGIVFVVLIVCIGFVFNG